MEDLKLKALNISERALKDCQQFAYNQHKERVIESLRRLEIDFERMEEHEQHDMILNMLDDDSRYLKTFIERFTNEFNKMTLDRVKYEAALQRQNSPK